MEKFVSIRTVASYGAESYIRSCVAAFCVSLAPTLDEISDVKTAVSEAVTKVIVHAYPNAIGEVAVDVRLDGRTIYIDVTDNGCGIEDVARARQAFFSGDPSGERSGVGFTVMDAFMDGLTVENRAEGGLRVSMKKEICGVARCPSTEEEGVFCAGS